MRFLEPVMDSDAAPAVLLVRLMVAFVFVTEGVLKFLAPDALGSGRFAKIGIPSRADGTELRTATHSRNSEPSSIEKFVRLSCAMLQKP